MSETRATPQPIDFVVQQSDLRNCRFTPAPAPTAIQLEPGEVLCVVDKFGFTANNITYAVAGELLSYWSFFPAEKGWGRIPVWGFADVIRSRCDDVDMGTRVYGYLPMSTHVVLQPVSVSPAGFSDGAPHRSALPPIYNRYERVQAAADADREDRQALLKPLFATGFLLDDWLADNDFFGARTVVLTSASSKTAFSLAFLLARNRGEQCRVVGLTAERNVPFVRRLGCYDEVLTYDAIDALADDATVSVDMAGNREVLSALHRHLRERLVYSCLVGAAHWQQARMDLGPGDPLPGAEPKFFFAPAQAQKRTAEWGAAGLQQRLAEALDRFLDETRGWINVHHGRGPADVERVYRASLEGRTPPDEGHILSLA